MIYLNDIIHVGELAGKTKSEVLQDYRDAVNHFSKEYDRKQKPWVEIVARGYLLETYMNLWQGKRK